MRKPARPGSPPSRAPLPFVSWYCVPVAAQAWMFTATGVV